MPTESLRWSAAIRSAALRIAYVPMRSIRSATCALSVLYSTSGTTNSGLKKGGPAARVTAKPSSHSAAKIDLRKVPPSPCRASAVAAGTQRRLQRVAQLCEP